MVNVATPVLESCREKPAKAAIFAVRMGDAVVVIAAPLAPARFN